MKKFLGNLFTKILAFVLVCIASPVLGVNLFFAAGAYDCGIYDRDVSFSETPICSSFVSENLAQIREYMYWEDVSGLSEHDYYNKHSNFAYSVFDSKGELVYSTLRDGFNLVVDNYPAREVDSSGNITAVYTMKGYIADEISANYDGYDEYRLFCFCKENSSLFIQLTVICFVICAVLCIYLITYSGINGNGEFALRGLNAVYYDILIAASVFVFLFFVECYISIGSYFLSIYRLISILLVFLGLTATVLVALMSTAAHFKMKKWWRHTFTYRFFSLLAKFFLWIMQNIGITWKIAAAVVAYSFVLFFLGIFSSIYFLAPFAIFFAFFGICAMGCVSIWLGSQLERIKRGGEAIAKGDFDYRIDSRKLWPSLRRHAYNLNCAALGMSKAVEDRLKSERFKTELITNVSHDLKTPLTSIVSYVDLLKKENIENETALGYIEVIDRQSAKLKKLTEDLVEASKASSGAVAVNKAYFNICELINQSVGEFSEKLEAANIAPVVNLPENEVGVYTDGRLLWRVFDNLIQNIIKYAQPGTRAYFGLAEEENNAVLTIRNISKEPLNMSAEALMERFVRGDASRNSEGNGLGLSIAKSLTELCGGTFELILDGDLFKVTVTIPIAEEA